MRLTKIKILKKKLVTPNPDKYENVDKEKYEYHLMCLDQNIDAEEIDEEDGYAIEKVKSVASNDSKVSIDAFWCADMQGNCHVLHPEAIKVDIDEINELYRKQNG